MSCARSSVNAAIGLLLIPPGGIVNGRVCLLVGWFVSSFITALVRSVASSQLVCMIVCVAAWRRLRSLSSYYFWTRERVPMATNVVVVVVVVWTCCCYHIFNSLKLIFISQPIVLNFGYRLVTIFSTIVPCRIFMLSSNILIRLAKNGKSTGSYSASPRSLQVGVPDGFGFAVHVF